MRLGFTFVTILSVYKRSIEITPDQLERKIKLLTLSSLAFKYIGQNLPYSEIAEALKIDTSEVEKWAIDGKLNILFLPPLHSGTIHIHGCWQSFALVLFGESYHKRHRAFRLSGPPLGRLSVSNGKH